jgi:LuxR family transcriptional regulator, quorum-sensing system regulator BjaR1
MHSSLLRREWCPCSQRPEKSPNWTRFSSRGSSAWGTRAPAIYAVFGEGQFHTAKYLFGTTAPGWAERYQTKQYSIDDPVVIAVCRMTGAFTLNEVAGPSRAGAPILAGSRIHGLFDGLCAPIRAGCDEVGFVLLGADRLLKPSDYERFLLQGMCEAYARAGLALLPMRADPPPLTRRETECLRWVAAGRSDPQIGMVLRVRLKTG